MSQPPIIGGVPLDGTPHTVQVKDIRLIPVASVIFAKGGCDRPGCDYRLEVVDATNGVVWLVPMTTRFITSLLKQITDTLGTLPDA